MQHVYIHNLDRPMDRPLKARTCASFFCRMRGLAFQKSLAQEKGVLLVMTRDSWLDAATHMLGALTDAGLVWINSAGRVVDVRMARRWNPAVFPRRPARYVLEVLPARLLEFHVGDQIRFEEA